MEDIKQQFEQLRRILVKIGYPHSVDKERICSGITTELLPLLHFGLLSHSKLLASFILDSGYDLYQKNDLRFTEGIYKLLRKEFKYNPVLQCAQFLTDKGFAKRKIQFVVKCLNLGIVKHTELTKKKKLQTQSKTPWNQTNLAKKVTKIIKKNQQNKAASSSLNVVSHKPAPKITQKKVRKSHKAPREIIATPTQHFVEDDPVLIHMNESLTADEIRCDLPQPIMMQNNPSNVVDDDDDGDDENQGEEEKAIEITNEALYNETPQSQKQTYTKINACPSVEAIDQSIQIPQHQYDVSLIPEYNPSKYTTQNVEEEDEAKDIHQNDEHYSSSYLDTYSTLMDIPATYLHTDEAHTANIADENQQHQSEETINDTNQHQEEQSRDNESEDDMYNNDEDTNDDDDINNNNNDNDGRENGEDKKEENNVTQNNNASNVVTEALKTIMSRLDSMEHKMETEFETIAARLTILEGKIKFVESKQQTQTQTQSRSQSARDSTVPNGASLPSSTNSAPVKSSLGRSSTWSEHKEYDRPTFTESTIGSCSLPVSLTPAPRNMMLNSNHDRNAVSKTVPRANPAQAVISSTIQNRYISSMTQHPKHIHAPTAKSPIIGDMNFNALSFGGTVNKQMYPQTQRMMRQSYGGNNMLRYPISSSSSDQRSEMKSNGGSGIMSMGSNNVSLSVPKIQSVPPVSSTSNGSHNSTDPDSTLNFIADLKEMLKSTDELLKSKPNLYGSNI